MRSDNLQVPYTSKSENLQLPCVQPPTSSYNFQLPQGRHGHHGCHSHDVHGGHGEHGGHGGQDRTEKDLFLAAFAILAMFSFIQLFLLK